MSDSPRAWELLDAGLARLAANGFRDAAWFYAGALPFAAALLWAFTRFASFHATTAAYDQAALLLSLLYAWKSYCSRRFVESLLPAPAADAAPAPLRALQSAAAGAIWLLAWVASLLTLFWATAPVYLAALYFPLELRSTRSRRPLRAAFRSAFQLGFKDYLQLQLFALHCLLISFAVAVNLALAAVIAPALLQRLLGLNTLWTNVPASQLASHSAIWVTLILTTWLLLAPLVQAAAVVAYDNRKSQATGNDLRLELARLEAALTPVAEEPLG